MFIASVAHILAFPVQPYRRAERLNWLRNIVNAANVSDLHTEVRHHCNHFYGRVRGALRRSGTASLSDGATAATSKAESRGEIDENTALLNEDLGTLDSSLKHTHTQTNKIDNYSLNKKVCEYGVTSTYETVTNERIVNIWKKKIQKFTQFDFFCSILSMYNEIKTI